MFQLEHYIDFLKLCLWVDFTAYESYFRILQETLQNICYEKGTLGWTGLESLAYTLAFMCLEY